MLYNNSKQHFTTIPALNDELDHQECVDEPAYELVGEQDHESQHASSLGEGEINVSLDNSKNFLLTSFINPTHKCDVNTWSNFFL